MLGSRILQYLHLQRRPAPATSSAVSANPAAAGVAVSPKMPPAPPAVAPKTATSLPVTPAGAPHVTVMPRAQPAPTPAKKPAVDRTPNVSPAPAAQKAPARQPTPRPRSRRPTPTPVAEATRPPLSPQQYLARLMREGHQLYQSGWYGPATARFKEAARVSPGSPTVLLWYGRSALRMGRTAEARAVLERVIALAPSSDAAREARNLLERMSGTE